MSLSLTNSYRFNSGHRGKIFAAIFRLKLEYVGIICKFADKKWRYNLNSYLRSKEQTDSIQANSSYSRVLI